MSTSTLELEIDANYDFFRRSYASIPSEQARRFAVIRQRCFEGFFDDVGEAAAFAARRFPDGLYSIQQVIDEPIDLGFFSHVGR